MWPDWVKIMDNFRSQRIEKTLYLPRRRSLKSEYERYVIQSSPDTSTFDLLPHVADLIRFPPFRDVIRAPEGTRLGDKPFASAFAQLSVLVDEWMRKVNSEIAGLVKIPSFLSPDNVSGDRNKVLGSTRHAKLCQTAMDKLHLACAVFHMGDTGPCVHPEVLSVSMRNGTMLPVDEELLSNDGIPRWIPCVDNSEHAGSIHDRCGLQFLEEAPYIIYACGLDPNVATVDDMDRRDARLRCLSCWGHTLVMNWKHAVRFALC